MTHVVITRAGMAAVECTLALRALAGPGTAIELLAPAAELVHGPSSVRTPFGGEPAPRVPLDRLAGRPRRPPASRRAGVGRGRAAPRPHPRRRQRPVRDPRRGRRCPFPRGGAGRRDLPRADERRRGRAGDRPRGGRAGTCGSPSSHPPARAGCCRSTSWRCSPRRSCASTPSTLPTSWSPPPSMCRSRSSGRPSARRCAGRSTAPASTWWTSATAVVGVRRRGTARERRLPRRRRRRRPAQLVGPRISGLPHDEAGYLPVDQYGRVVGCSDIFAAGDATAFPIKQAAWPPSRRTRRRGDRRAPRRGRPPRAAAADPARAHADRRCPSLRAGRARRWRNAPAPGRVSTEPLCGPPARWPAAIS